ncbi:MAG: hypothetical protein WC467_02000 [Patescibacteria group bacterium]
MPRAKKNPEAKTEKKPILKPKSKTKSKLPAAKVSPKKKARPVVVDVIEDIDDVEPEQFFPEFKETESGLPESLSTLGSEMPEEIDQQKNFYSKLVTEIKDKNPKPGSAAKKYGENEISEDAAVPKSVNLYRRLVWRFIAFTAVLLLAVFYFSFSKLEIIISPKGEAINDSLLLKIQPAGAVSANADTDFREQVSGTVREVAVSAQKDFSATGEEYTGEEIAGSVSIINNTAKAQALVATTRLLSPDNKLYRIKNAVNVPGGGEVTVDIYVDKPVPDLAIAPTSFTIPGLWAGLQDKIYAKSSSEFVYRQKVKKFIKASDIEQATKEMNASLIAQAKQSQITSPGVNSQTLYETLDSSSFAISAKAGDAQDNFSIAATGSMVVISFSKDEVAKLAAAKLSLLIPDDKELVDYNSADIVYSFDNYDVKTGVATVKASFNGTMVLKNNTEIIDKKHLVNLNRSQLENYLKTFPEIKSYELKFYPAFINRAPRLPERIQISIKGLEK